MDQDAYGTLASLHDLSDLSDAQFADDPEQHRVGLVGRQRADDRESTFEGLGLLGTLADIGRTPGRGRGDLALGSFRAAFARADLVDSAAGCDREQPTSEVGLVAFETVESGRDVEPHGRGEIFGFVHASAAKISEEEMLVCAPELAEGLAVPGPRASNHLLHLS
jgi:hypothetical protein